MECPLWVGSRRHKAGQLELLSAAIRLSPTERRLPLLEPLVRWRGSTRCPLLQLGVQVYNLKRGDHLLRFRATGELNHGFACVGVIHREAVGRSEEHTSELQSLMRISYAVFCLKKKK